MTKKSRNIETSLDNIADLLGIRDEKAWKTNVGKFFGVKHNTISTWIKYEKIPKKRLELARKKGYPPEQWLVTETPPDEKALTPYEQPPEHMRPRDSDAGKDSDAGEAGRSDIERHQVVELVTNDDDWYIEAVRQILAGEEKGTAEALKSNIRQFHEQILDKVRIRQMEKEIWALKQRVDLNLQNKKGEAV